MRQRPFFVGWGMNRSLVAYPLTSGMFSTAGLWVSHVCEIRFKTTSHDPRFGSSYQQLKLVRSVALWNPSRFHRVREAQPRPIFLGLDRSIRACRVVDVEDVGVRSAFRAPIGSEELHARHGELISGFLRQWTSSEYHDLHGGKVRQIFVALSTSLGVLFSVDQNYGVLLTSMNVGTIGIPDAPTNLHPSITFCAVGANGDNGARG